MKRVVVKGILAAAMVCGAAAPHCAGKTLRNGESEPLKDKAGKIFGTRHQISGKTERCVIDADQNGIPEKQYIFENDVITSSEHFFPDGKVKVRTVYMRGKANRSEVFRPDGSVQGIAYHNEQEVVDTVDLPNEKRRVEFLSPR